MYKILIFFLSSFILFMINSCGTREPQDPEKVFTEFEAAENLDEKMIIFDLFKETNPGSYELKSMVNLLSREIKNEEGILSAAEFLMENKESASSTTFNSIAWQFYESKENLDFASKIAEKGTEIARNDYETYRETIPENISEEDWERSRKQSLVMILDTYANIEKEKGDNESAILLFEEAVELSDEEFAEINENYVSALIEKKDYSKAQSLLEKYISEGTDSENMGSMLKEIYNKINQSADGFEGYVAEFEEKARGKMIERLKDEIEERPAADFTLLDLEGKSVKLSDFKGQTVVLDFWATWCGPCLQSFPGMKKAVQKLSKQNNVKFLFVNTWERVENKKENAVDFINKNEYPFHVLLDEENEVVKKYGVRGIPTKFIIDKNQNIRFESIGFRGKTDELVDELSLMVSMVE